MITARNIVGLQVIKKASHKSWHFGTNNNVPENLIILLKNNTGREQARKKRLPKMTFNGLADNPALVKVNQFKD